MASDLKAGEILLVENESLPHLLKDDSFVKALSEQLKIFLPSKRWYGAKDDVIASILPEKTVPVGDVIITVVRVRLESGASFIWSKASLLIIYFVESRSGT